MTMTQWCHRHSFFLLFMMFLVLSFFFVSGLIIGSFLNVVILRGERGEGFGGRSRCMACGRMLGFFELIPVFSFLAQKGKCRGCKELISWQYPLVELATALAFAGSAWYFLPVLFNEGGAISAPALLGFGLACAGIGAMLVILVSDLRFQIIPDGAVLILFVVAASRIFIQLFQTASGIIPDAVWNGIIHDVVSALVIASFFFFLWFASGGRWMGFGDVKLIAATSLFLGYPAAIAGVLFAFWMGGTLGAILLLTGKKKWRSRIPFGPSILAGAVAAWQYADVFFGYTGFSLWL